MAADPTCAVCKTTLPSSKGRRTFDPGRAPSNKRVVDFFLKICPEVGVDKSEFNYTCKPCFAEIEKSEKLFFVVEGLVNSVRSKLHLPSCTLATVNQAADINVGGGTTQLLPTSHPMSETTSVPSTSTQRKQSLSPDSDHEGVHLCTSDPMEVNTSDTTPVPFAEMEPSRSPDSDHEDVAVFLPTSDLMEVNTSDATPVPSTERKQSRLPSSDQSISVRDVAEPSRKRRRLMFSPVKSPTASSPKVQVLILCVLRMIGEKREGAYLFQRLSMAVQQGNTISIMGSLSSHLSH